MGSHHFIILLTLRLALWQTVSFKPLLTNSQGPRFSICDDTVR